ncbi:MAG: hypothetical protein M1817_001116 [Caeruleum heppii]|nr:MAG: hypothetical protein M1817_001116 [Caeruleum heppii]
MVPHSLLPFSRPLLSCLILLSFLTSVLAQNIAPHTTDSKNVSQVLANVSVHEDNNASTPQTHNLTLGRFLPPSTEEVGGLAGCSVYCDTPIKLVQDVNLSSTNLPSETSSSDLGTRFNLTAFCALNETLEYTARCIRYLEAFTLAPETALLLREVFSRCTESASREGTNLTHQACAATCSAMSRWEEDAVRSCRERQRQDASPRTLRIFGFNRTTTVVTSSEANATNASLALTKDWPCGCDPHYRSLVTGCRFCRLGSNQSLGDSVGNMTSECERRRFGLLGGRNNTSSKMPTPVRQTTLQNLTLLSASIPGITRPSDPTFLLANRQSPPGTERDNLTITRDGGASGHHTPSRGPLNGRWVIQADHRHPLIVSQHRNALSDQDAQPGNDESTHNNGGEKSTRWKLKWYHGFPIGVLGMAGLAMLAGMLGGFGIV